MVGERVQKVFFPQYESEWALIETDACYYSIRLGGIRSVHPDTIDFGRYSAFVSDVFENKAVQDVWTDDHWVYIVLADGNIIESGWNRLSGDDSITLGISFSTLKDYEDGFFEGGDMKRLQ